MIFDLLFSGQSLTDILLIMALTLPMMLLALSMHEASHGYAAYKCGDMTAYNMGRLTLNPIKHLHPMGFLCMMITGFGWARPVPVNARNFRDPKKGMAITAAAGPLANMLLGTVCTVLYALFSVLYVKCVLSGASSFWITCTDLFTLMFWYGAMVNFIFMVFNLIPLPPFDGSRIFYVFLPQKFYFAVMQYERQIMLGVLVGMILLSRLLNFSPFSFVAELLMDLIAQPVARLFQNLIF